MRFLHFNKVNNLKTDLEEYFLRITYIQMSSHVLMMIPAELKSNYRVYWTRKIHVKCSGNGPKPCFMEDPFIRLLKWGANLQTNTINLESELQGRTKRLTRDVQLYTMDQVQSKPIQYPVCQPSTNQSRATHPAWLYKDLKPKQL